MQKFSFSVFILSAWLTGVSFSPVYAAQLQTANPAPADTDPVILVLGDSLSAAFGVTRSRAWVNLLEQRFADSDYHYRIVNASISGETTQGGLQRLPELLKKYQPYLVILELGGNDGLRGLDIEMIKTNLQAMISRALAADARVLLLGMKLPPNYGPDYTARFAQIYVDLAQRNKIHWVPFLLDGIATKQELMQEDGIHPNDSGQPAMLHNVWPKLQSLLEHGTSR